MQASPEVFLAFDFGTKRIGLAQGQTHPQLTKPLKVIKNKNNVPNWQAIVSEVENWEPQALVVGIPLNMDGTEQAMTHRAKHFAKQLSEKTGLPVLEADERLTTIEAKAQLFESPTSQYDTKADLDSLAAQIILESFLTHYVTKA